MKTSAISEGKLEVTCAIIRNDDDEVLVVQRGENSDHPFKWEFPGGKLDKGETAEDCIIREIREELNMEIVIRGSLPPFDYDYGSKHIILLPFICDTLDDKPVLTEHISSRWITPDILKDIDFSEADILVADAYARSIKILPHAEAAGAPEIKDDGLLKDNDLRSMIERMVSTREVDWLASSAVDNPVIFRRLYDFSFSSDRKLAFRSSWILTKACDKVPGLIIPYLHDLVLRIDDIDNESVQRSFLRILSLSDLNLASESDHGILAEHCFSALRSGFSAIAIKAYAMEILYKLAVKYPDLTNELAATINMLRGEGSAGIVSRGNAILRKLTGLVD
jgi:8-oxo-dGTP diphosphatase